MYEAFYGLADKPFQANPDPSFYFGSRQHRRAMAYLDYGMHRNEGFIIITGEVGAGKTTVVRNLLSKLDRDSIISAHLVSTQLDAENALRMVSAAFGIPTTSLNKADLLLALQQFLGDAYRAGKRCLLVVDEAQNLSMQAVEELRMLSNFQIDTHALLQSFLIGQPEFRHTLQSPQMTQLRQRIIAACHIGPLDSEETQAYIEHRLTRAGWKSSPQFSPDVFPAIHEASGGIPRRINTICDRLLLTGFLSDTRTFSESDVFEVVREIKSETFAPKLVAVPAGAELLHPHAVAVSGSTESRGVIDDLIQDDMALRMTQVEQRMARIEAALDGLLRNNSSALALLGRLVDRVEKPEQAQSE
ncbi:general secretion pathway protein A [Actimicrobium sp. GrIS 1.19]|uniref:XrtA/PEP-CTERM system-associated ATPase n=1 Tax=Actimicrobium sp. GrIS 1.19 TaxID=3071708 RepID=UPI002DF8DA60|nr:general secretion pathway protein A [Actimicrobium sp. GrIS 1.19]